MTSNELMIGDWVIRKDVPEEKLRVVAIDSIKGIVYLDLDGLGIIEKLTNIEPIPLTTEILNKNGLFNDPYLYDEVYHDSDNFPPLYFEEDVNHNLEIIKYNGKIYWSIGCAEYCIIELRYVHQLQHALRLCGINKDIKL